jgi:STE24 endopeptidase
MPILVLLLLSAACLPDARQFALFDWELRTRCFASLGCVFLGWIASIAVSRSIVRADQSSASLRNRVVKRYFFVRRLLFFFNFGLSLLAIFAFGWGHAVDELFTIQHGDRCILAPFAELLVSAPYLALVIANWFVFYPAERSLSRSAAAGKDQRFWSLPGFVLFQARQFALLILFPVVLFASQLTLLRYFPELTNTLEYQIGSFLAICGMLVLLPRLAKPLLGWKSLPTGKHRDQLDATGKRLGFRRTDLLIWPTHGAVANALILGVIPQARYVVFTDRIFELLDPPELDAVFGHEVGHAHHGHLAYYALFLLFSAFSLSLAFAVIQTLLAESGWLPEDWQEAYWALPIIVMGSYLFVVFGWLSRSSERQADISGAKAASCGNPACEGHNSETILGNGRTLCPTGVRSMIQALELVIGSHGLDSESSNSLWKRWMAWFRSWQHGAPNVRIAFLLDLIEKPELAAQHDRKSFGLRVTLIAILFGIVVASGSAIGWNEMWKLL